MPEHKLRIGITQGDTNGIGWEVILKALADPRMTELFTPVVYGSPEAAAYYRNTIAEIEPVSFNPVASAAEARRGKVNLAACGQGAEIVPGKAAADAGRAAVEALCAAVRDLKEGHLDAVVTAPFDKETVQADDFRHTGHTEYLAAEFGGEAMMIMCSDVLRVGLVTKHIPVSEIARSITKERIVKNLHTLRRSLVEDFGIENPYDIVDAGKWTLDKVAEIASAASQDIDGNSKYNIEDKLGFVVHDWNHSKGFWASTESVMYSRDSSGEWKFTYGSEHDIDVVNKLYNLMYANEGSWFPGITNAAPENQELYGKISAKFASGDIIHHDRRDRRLGQPAEGHEGRLRHSSLSEGGRQPEGIRLLRAQHAQRVLYADNLRGSGHGGRGARGFVIVKP